MFLMLSNISLEEIKTKEDLRDYVVNTDYFSLAYCSNKNKLIDNAEGWIAWYCLFSTKPLYITVMSDRYWNSIKNTMNNSVKCTTWKYIPSGGFDAKYEDVIPEKDRLCNEDKIKHICETIKNANIKDKPLEIHLIKEEI